MNTGTTGAILLECIDGKDDFLKLEIVPGRKIILGQALNGEDSTVIKELEAGGGCIAVTNTGTVLLVDASGCSMPVKINGQPVTQNNLKQDDVLRIGNSIWKMHLPGQSSTSFTGTTNSIRQGFNKLIGLEELKDFRLKDIFSQVFKKHTASEMEDQLVTGTMSSTPVITDIETSWARPWLFSRLLLVSFGLTLLLMFGFQTFKNENLIPGLIFIGSFAVPVSTLIFFLEMNAPRNISVFITMTLVFIGGVTSLFLALIFFDRLQFLSTLLKASAAGIIEEIAKVLILVALFGRVRRYKWVLNGLLLGAAIGTGFAAFESSGYAYRSTTFQTIVDSIVLRGLLAPFMHIVWTANAAAALWMVKGDRKFQFSMVTDMRFLRVMISSMLLHMTWNAEFSTIPIPIFLDLKYVMLGLIAWVITFRLVQTGLSQLNAARHAEVQRLSAT